MNFISREETSVIVSARGLWHTRDGWRSNRCVWRSNSLISDIFIGGIVFRQRLDDRVL